MNHEDGQDLTFADLEFGLVALMRQREEYAEACERTRGAHIHDGREVDDSHDIALAALDQCDLAIAAYLQAEVQKVDGVAAFILSRRARAKMNKEECDRLYDYAEADERAAAYVEKMVLRVMQETEQRTIEGARHTLKLKLNPPAVVIAQPDIVPLNVQKFTLSMTYDEIRVLLDTSESTRKLACKAKREPSKSAIAAALKARVKCDECAGAVNLCPAGPSDAPMNVCPRCKGEGTIQGSVSGCRLESAERLVIE